MSYHRGSFNRSTSPGRGSFGTKQLRQAFLNLSNAVRQSAENAASRVLTSQDSYQLTFDETEAVPITVPSSGTIMLVGTSDTDDASLAAATQQLANQSLAAMTAELSRSMKEAGYD